MSGGDISILYAPLLSVYQSNTHDYDVAWASLLIIGYFYGATFFEYGLSWVITDFMVLTLDKRCQRVL